MRIDDFKLECFFDEHEFEAPYLLCQSDCESLTIRELLELEPGAEEAFAELGLGYGRTWGDPELRGLIAGLYEKATAQDVLVLSGAQEGIFALMNVLLDEGDHYITMFPAYQSHYSIAEAVPGCEVSRWMLHDAGEDGWTIDLDELEALIRPNTRLIAVTSPNNPTGFTFTDEQAQRLCALCESHGIRLLADEVYRGTELDGSPRRAFADLSDKAVSLGVMSKSYGLPGLRLGWIVSKDADLLYRVEKFKHYTTICSPVPSEFLATVALRHSDELLERTKKIITRNKEYAHMFFLEHQTLFEFKDNPCGPVAFHKLLIDMPVDAFCERVRTGKGVLLLPGTLFDYEGPYFRMGYGKRSFPEALMQFDAFLQEGGYAVKDEAALAMLPFILNGLLGS